MLSPHSLLSYIIAIIFMLALPMSLVGAMIIKRQTGKWVSIPNIAVAFVGLAGFIYGIGYGSVVISGWFIETGESWRVRPSLLMVAVALLVSIVGIVMATWFSKAREEVAERETLLMQNINHELRTPFALMYGYIELIDSGSLGVLSDEVAGIIHRIRQKMTYSRLLLERNLVLLTMDEPDVPFSPVRLSIDDIVNDTVADLGVLVAEGSRDLDVVNGGMVKTAVMGDARLLWLAMNNLCANAIKFTPDGGRIEVGSYEDGRYAVVYVADTGIGIAKSDLGKIFERFRQLDGSATRKYGGVGIGLNFVKSVVELHGGHVSVQSTIGDGSTFFVYLPKVAQ